MVITTPQTPEGLSHGRKNRLLFSFHMVHEAHLGQWVKGRRRVIFGTKCGSGKCAVRSALHPSTQQMLMQRMPWEIVINFALECSKNFRMITC